MSAFQSLSKVKQTFDKPLYTISIDLRLTHSAVRGRAACFLPR
jgi:hypothetical protein